jgi:formylmethanofuran dehydrogenase subunit E
MESKEIRMDALKFHGHRCWASVAGVRIGQAALRTLGVKRSEGTQLYSIVEIGEERRGMCFGDGVQYATGCTFGKGNIRKELYGKLALKLIDKATNRSVRVSYKPTLQKQISDRRLCGKGGMGVMPDEIPLGEQMDLLDLVWNTPETDILKIGEIQPYQGEWFPEVMGFKPCTVCGELTAHAYLRLVGDKHVCIPCSGYDR